MALTDIIVKPRQKGGKGGLFGSIIGGTLGAVGGLFAGNPVAGASAGAALGSSLGGMAGKAIDPGKVVGQTKMEKVETVDPEVQIAQMLDAQKALYQDPSYSEPEKQEIDNQIFIPTLDALRARQQKLLGGR